MADPAHHFKLRNMLSMRYSVAFSIDALTDFVTEPLTTMDKTTTTEFEAAAFRRLVSHLQDRTDVQNIDMMNLAGFCRNCMSRWYREAANTSGLDMNETAARAIIYGMDYADWKAKFQTEATAEQKAKYDKIHPHTS